MKNQTHQEKPQISSAKLFTIQLNLHSLVLFLLVFSCFIAVGTTLFSTFPGTLSILAQSLNVTRSSFNQTRLVQFFSITPSNTSSEGLSSSSKGGGGARERFVHHMEDEELLWRASIVPRIRKDPVHRVRKVAFMFPVKRTMHLAPLWDRFFKGNEGFYSIYLHASAASNATFPEDSVFHGRRIPSKNVRWGDFNMVEAERRLLASALLDFSNQRFILLSESCIPLFNFSTVYSYLINSRKTFVEAYDQPGPVGRDRYNHRMRPVVRLSQWRKGSQWFQIDRRLAVEVVSDHSYFGVFKRHCKGRCYGDEHYLPTFVSIKFRRRNSNRTLTWVDWSRGGPHPATFQRPRVTVVAEAKEQALLRVQWEGGKSLLLVC